MEVSEVSPIVDGSYKTSINDKRKREYKHMILAIFFYKKITRNLVKK